MDNDEAEFSSDSKFRTYSSQVERALKAFESSSEWPDLIAALGRLSRVLHQYSKYQVIPRKILVGKRLSQCLHPALPAGVHLKALECYDIIFRNIGSARLATNLAVYCSGIFPLLGPSAMTVKSPLFDIYENHFLPLGPALRPAFVGLLQGLLPGLEEGAEFYGRTQKLLENLSDRVGLSFFYTCLWQVMLQAPTCRPYGLAFLLNHVDRKGICTSKNVEDISTNGTVNNTTTSNSPSTQTQLPYTGLIQLGNNMNLVLNSMCAILGDSQVLVQRCALDFLLTCVPIHCTELLTRADRVTLCAAALGCLLRRDMSLNRRLSNWLMGAQLSTVQQLNLLTTQTQTNDESMGSIKLARSLSESENHMQKLYFEKYAKAILIDAVKEMIRHPNSSHGNDRTASIRPFRIVTTLMDLANLGNSIIEDILLDLILYMHEEYNRLEILSEASSSSIDDYTLGSRRVLSQNLTIQTTSTLVRDLQKDSTSAPSRRLTIKKGPLGSIGGSSGGGGGGSSGGGGSTLMDDFLKTANLFFANLESSFFWGFLNRLLDECCGMLDHQESIQLLSSTITTTANALLSRSLSSTTTPLLAQGLTLCDLCTVVNFVLIHLPIETYSDVPSQHLPKLIQHIIFIMKERCTDLSLIEIDKLLDLTSLLFTQILQHTASTMDIHLSSALQADNVINVGVNKTVGNVSTLSNITSRTNLHQETELMLSAVEFYRAFFEAFSINKMSLTKTQVRSCLESVKNAKLSYSAFHDLLLRIPFDQQANVGVIGSGGSGGGGGGTYKSQPHKNQHSHLLITFTKVCRLLVDMVSYPLSGNENKINSNESCENIPNWLNCLLVAAVFVDNFSVKTLAMGSLLDILHATISLYGHPIGDSEQVALNDYATRTTVSGPFRRRIWDRVANFANGGSMGSSENPIEIRDIDPLTRLSTVAVSFPTISFPVLRYLFQKTCLFQLMGLSLWEYMSGDRPQCHRQAVSLFLRLHKLTPPSTSATSTLVSGNHSNALCEDLLLSEMLSDDSERALEGQARFLLIWHLQHQQQLAQQINNNSANENNVARPQSSSIATASTTNAVNDNGTGHSILISTSKLAGAFDKCLFVLLDGLDNKQSMEPARQEIARQWLLSAIVNGEMPHVLEPLLLGLLEPHSVRISFPTASNLWNSNVSNVAATLNESIYSLAITPTTSGKDLVESTYTDCSQSEPNVSSTADEQSIYRRSKTFSEFDLPPNESAIGDSQISSMSSDETDNEEDEGYLIVNDLLSDLINNVVVSQDNSYRSDATIIENKGLRDRQWSDTRSMASRQSDSLSLHTTQTTPSIINNNNNNNTTRTQISGKNNNNNINNYNTLVILPVHSHFLLYRQSANSFDWRRALYILGRTHAILTTWPREVIIWCLSTLIHANASVNDCVVLNSGVTAKFPGIISAVPGLMARHKQALEGGNFYQGTGAEQLTAFRRMCYIECILHLSLNFVRSLYVPPGLAGLGRNNASDETTLTTIKKDDNQLMQELRMGNRRVQLLALHCIHGIVNELCNFLLSLEPLRNPTRSFPKTLSSLSSGYNSLITMPIMSSKELRSFCWDMCVRLRLAPIILQSLTSTVLLGVTNQALIIPNQMEDKDSNSLGPLSSFIVFWNEIGLHNTQWQSAFLQALLDLSLAILRLEAAIFYEKHSSNAQKDDHPLPKAYNLLSWEELPLMKYESTIPLAHQSLCLSTIVTALRDPFQRRSHVAWFHFLLSAQPYWGRALVSVLPNTIRALTRCIRQVAWDYFDCATSNSIKKGPSRPTDQFMNESNMTTTYPANYALDLLDCLQGLIHSVFLNQNFENLPTSFVPTGQINYEGGAFSWFYKNKEPTEKDSGNNIPSYLIDTRKELIRILPRLIFSLAFLWKSVKVCDEKQKDNQDFLNNENDHRSSVNNFMEQGNVEWSTRGPMSQSACIMGSCAAVHHGIKQLLCPLTQCQSSNNGPPILMCLLTATAGCWRSFSLAHMGGGGGSSSSGAGGPNATGGGNNSNKQSISRKSTSGHFDNTDEQEVLVDMLWPLMTTEVLVTKITELVRSAAGVTLATAKPPLRVEVPRLTAPSNGRCNWVQLGQERLISPSLLQSSLLHFVFTLCRKQSSKQMIENYSIYINLLKDSVACSLQPMGCFLLLKIFGEFLSKLSLPEDKREQKELQDVSQRLIEAVAGVAGSSLEQSSWFRRGVQVKVDELEPSTASITISSRINHVRSTTSPQHKSPNESSIDTVDGGVVSVQQQRLPITASPTNLAREQSILSPSLYERNNRIGGGGIGGGERMGVSDTPAYLPHGVNTVQAFECLTEHMSVIFDMVYRSEERDRVASILTSSVLPYVFPFLKLRSVGNLSNLRASSKLLASISSYQYTRKAWRKETFDLLLEYNFFQFDLPTMRAWTTIVDNLMTQDKNTFKEALPRLTISGPGALNILFSREAEYDQRAACIKKLSFILFSSEKDQYVRFMPELQERLTECLRMGLIPQLHAQVFLCFRVLLMRISSNHLTSLWQNILRELILVFQMMRQEYIDIVKNVASATPDGKTGKSTGGQQTRTLPNVVQSQKHMAMYLSACKLLDFALLMPEEQVPQFHFFKWTFVGDRDACEVDKSLKSDVQPSFKPNITELSDFILQEKMLKEDLRIYRSDLQSNVPLLYDSTVNSLQDLSNFLVTLSMRHDSEPMRRLASHGVPVLSPSTDFHSAASPINSSDSLENVLHQVMELDFIEAIPK